MSARGKVVVVTGSTRGIGRAIADACAAAGATVVVSSRTPEDVDAAVRDIAASGGSVSGFACDVASTGDLQALFDHALERWGRLDVWINNAGISLGYRPLDEIAPQDLRRIVDVNITGTVVASRIVLPHFREQGGILVNMAGRGYRGEATPYTAAYAMTKTAVTSLTRSLAEENRSAPVSVHALVPGMVPTGFYENIEVSPRLANTSENWRFALDAFGVSLAEVGARAVEIVSEEPGAATGRIYSLLGGRRMARGIAKMMWYRATGKMKVER